MIVEEKVTQECLKSLRKVADNLGKTRVEYMNSGSDNLIIKEIFEIEKKVYDEILDLERLEKESKN